MALVSRSSHSHPLSAIVVVGLGPTTCRGSLTRMLLPSRPWRRLEFGACHSEAAAEALRTVIDTCCGAGSGQIAVEEESVTFAQRGNEDRGSSTMLSGLKG